VVRERVRDAKEALGRKLIDVPGYTFRIFFTNRSADPLELWRDYNKRAHRTDLGVENPNFAEVGVRSIGSPHVLLDLTRFFTSNFGVRV
jgi:hypothetical protein